MEAGIRIPPLGRPVSRGSLPERARSDSDSVPGGGRPPRQIRRSANEFASEHSSRLVGRHAAALLALASLGIGALLSPAAHAQSATVIDGQGRSSIELPPIKPLPRGGVLDLGSCTVPVPGVHGNAYECTTDTPTISVTYFNDESRVSSVDLRIYAGKPSYNPASRRYAPRGRIWIPGWGNRVRTITFSHRDLPNILVNFRVSRSCDDDGNCKPVLTVWEQQSNFWYR